MGRYFDAEQQSRIPEPSRVFTAEEAVPVPGYLPDLPEVRTEYAEYLSSSRRCDDVVAAVLAELDASGQRDRTLVVFLSDNGMAFPFSKANCYLQSTRTPLIVRWPGVVAEGGRLTTSYYSMLDLFPTLCEAAGVSPGETDGRSMIPALRGEDAPGRDSVVTVFHETAMKGRYEMRCIQDGEYGYIWNEWADGDRAYRAENMIGLTWPAMVDAAETDAAIAERTRFYQTRVPEEFYHLASDPHSLRNLAGDPSHAPALNEKRRALAEWMAQTGDPLTEEFSALLASTGSSEIEQ